MAIDAVAERISRLSGLSGTTINNGRVELVKLLGSGGYGAVYLGTNKYPTEEYPADVYAVKCLMKESNSTSRARRQQNEIDLHTRASGHPNVVGLHGVLYESDYIFLILDYCPGGDMFSAISDTRVYARNDVLIKDTFLKLLDAVEYCHARGIAHRDIKPENILCNKDGSNPLLADFGLSTEKKMTTDLRCGSSLYMSPECISRPQGGPEDYLTHPSDVWSLGIILINMISGKAGWRKAAMEDRSYADYVQNRHTYFRNLIPVSWEAEVILKSMLNPDPLFRSSLQTVRQRVKAINTFYMTREELAQAPDGVWSIYMTYSPKLLVVKKDTARKAPVVHWHVKENSVPSASNNILSNLSDLRIPEPSPPATVTAIAQPATSMDISDAPTKYSSPAASGFLGTSSRTEVGGSQGTLGKASTNTKRELRGGSSTGYGTIGHSYRRECPGGSSGVAGYDSELDFGPNLKRVGNSPLKYSVVKQTTSRRSLWSILKIRA